MDAIETDKLILIFLVLAVVLVAMLGYILRQLQNSTRELKSRLEASQQEGQELRDTVHNAELEMQALESRLEKERELGEQKIEQFEANRKALTIEFENLANKILDDKARSFDKTNKTSIESLLKPFREQVEGFQKRINDVHSESIKGNTALEGEIKKVLEVGMKIGSDAQNLTDALKGSSQKRGSWGETLLEKTLQMGGLIEDAHYEKQSSMVDAEGRRKQTDFLIKLPDGKHIIIDSKVSLAAYDRAVAAETDEQARLALDEHANSVKRHIDDLASKDYTNLAGIRSPGFVLMFMPIEPAYIEALKYEKDLFAYGYDKNIVLVSHTTLIPILRTVANLWSLERSSREARQLGEKAGEIYNQLCKVAERLGKLGGSLGAAANHYNKTVDALGGRQGLHGKVERFSKLSSKVSKSMPALEPIHNDLKSESLELLAQPLQQEPPEAEGGDANAVKLPQTETEDEAPVT